jgi:WD40 repeat protein
LAVVLRRLGAPLGLVALVWLALAQGALGATVSDEEALGRFGEEAGSGAGQLKSPSAAATDPATGHLYVAEDVNNRVSEFTPWGEFVKAFGWDVAPEAVNEQQEVRIRAASGQFKLGFEAQQTPDLSFSASAQEVKEALEGLAGIGSGGVEVKRAAGVLDGSVPVIYVVSFKGALAGKDVAQLQALNGTTELSGGSPTTIHEVRTRADGHGATTGLEACTAESGCKAGTEGAGVGQLNAARGMAVDANGNVYLREVNNLRVQKFDSAGRFVLMFGGEVDKTTNANRCTKASGDVCGVGVAGTGIGEFANSNSQGIALSPAEKLFVSDVERIQRFSLEGEWEVQVPVTGRTVHALAIAPSSGDFYATVGEPFGTDEGVRKLDGESGAEIGQLEGVELEGNPATKKTAGPVATDPAGEVFTRRNNVSPSPVLQFDSGGEQISEFGKAEAGFIISAIATNPIGDVYAAYEALATAPYIAAFGPGPTTLEAPPAVPPQINAQFAVSVWEDGATLAARINPRFWTNTRYLVQYGTGKCSEGGCTEEVPAAPGALLTEKTVNAPLRTADVALVGLSPDTTYHYRFVAESGAGGPTIGEERSFTTPKQLGSGPCPNDALRVGAGARLPDCRAYELVSPLDKNNGDVATIPDEFGYKTGLAQSAADGQRLTYSSYRAFAEPEGAPYTSQFLARRSPGGWSSRSIDPPIEADGVLTHSGFPRSESLFKIFSADLCESWLVAAGEPALGPGAIAEYPNLYRRDNCGEEGAYEALLREGEAQPSGEVEPLFFLVEMQGAVADGSEAVFRVRDRLVEGAASKAWQTYYANPSGLQLVCVLPSGSPGGGNCSAGTGGQIVGQPRLNRLADVAGALSEDGTRLYWTASGASESGPGKVYLRLNPGREQSEVSGGECTEAAKACTLKVSETVSTEAARFLTATPDGSKALFEVTEAPLAGSLYEFDLASGESTLIAKGVGNAGPEPFAGLVGESKDLSYVYLTSSEASPQAENEGAVAGRPNLYLFHEGQLSFIATLSSADVRNVEIPSDTSPNPVYHAARVSADGRTLAFLSTESLGGYDNADQESEEADSEVYLYRVGSAGPACVSCNPSGARPRGRDFAILSTATPLPSAATLPGGQSLLHLPRSLSADGKRLFFESFDALLPRDTNGTEDVYEWEAAGSEGECEELGAELYVKASGGCLSLISSGRSKEDSEFMDASLSGDDVFFTTNEGLLASDTGLIDVYDARVGGGFPIEQPPPVCLGETCQPSVGAPDPQTPSSSSYEGPGDLQPPKKKKHHKHHHHRKQAGKKRRGRR